MSTQEHSPLPWRATRSDPAEGADVWWITAGSGNAATDIGTVAGGYPHALREANARLIVTAVNAHAELLAAAKRYLAADYEDNPALTPLQELQAAIAHAEELPQPKEL